MVDNGANHYWESRRSSYSHYKQERRLTASLSVPSLFLFVRSSTVLVVGYIVCRNHPFMAKFWRHVCSPLMNEIDRCLYTLPLPSYENSRLYQPSVETWRDVKSYPSSNPIQPCRYKSISFFHLILQQQFPHLIEWIDGRSCSISYL